MNLDDTSGECEHDTGDAEGAEVDIWIDTDINVNAAKAESGYVTSDSEESYERDFIKNTSEIISDGDTDVKTFERMASRFVF